MRSCLSCRPCCIACITIGSINGPTSGAWIFNNAAGDTVQCVTGIPTGPVPLLRVYTSRCRDASARNWGNRYRDLEVSYRLLTHSQLRDITGTSLFLRPISHDSYIRAKSYRRKKQTNKRQTNKQKTTNNNNAKPTEARISLTHGPLCLKGTGKGRKWDGRGEGGQGGGWWGFGGGGSC